MRRITLVSCLSLAVLASACTDAGRPLVIIQNQVPEAGCVVPGSANNDYRGIGFVDVNSPGGYLFFPLVQNVATGARNDISRHVVSLRGADVSLEFQEGVLGATIPENISRDLKLTHLTSGTVGPDGDTTGLAFVIITQSMLKSIRDDLQVLETDGTNFFTIIATVTVFGEMDGGTVESEEFVYPVQVCDGCLKQNLGACEALPAGFVAAQGFECTGLLQDRPVDCCTTAGGLELCPATTVAGGA